MKLTKIKHFFQEVQEAADPKIFSKAVLISRSAQFFREDDPDLSKLSVRVSERGHTMSRLVGLWFEEFDWHCNCSSQEDPCEHVVAATIVVKNLHEKGEKLAAAQTQMAYVHYHFQSDEQNLLSFERFVVGGDGPKYKLISTLTALASKRVPGPYIQPQKEDLAVDLLLGDHRCGLVGAKLLPKLISHLAPCQNIYLDGQVVQCRKEKTGLMACVEDHGGGVRVFGKQHPDILKSYRNGAALCKGQILRPIEHGKLSSQELKLLAQGQQFGLKEIPHLVSELLPELEKRFQIEVSSSRLPQQIHLMPYLVINTKKSGERLSLTPQIVYGDPIIARVERGQLIAKGSQIPIRNLKEERKLQAQLTSDVSLHTEQELSLEGAEAVSYLEKLLKRKMDLRGSAVQAFSRRENLEAHVDFSGSNCEIHFSNAKGEQASSQRVFMAWQKNERLVPLLNGGWAYLPERWLKEHGKILQDIVNAKAETTHLNPCMASDVSQLCDSLDYDLPKYWQKLKDKFSKFSGIPPVSLSPALEKTLRPYQKQGVSWLSFLKECQLGAMLADDMGLGKTLQSICILEKRSLVVAPISILYNWQREILRFRPELKVSIFHGAQRSFDEDADVILTSYALLRLELERLQSYKWAVCVLDEAQHIKNPSSKVAQAAYQIEAKFRVALSGTPIENSLEDIWSHFRFLNHGLLGSRSAFYESYMRPINQGKLEIEDHLHNRVKPFILRRMKTEVATELPARTDSVLYCQLDEQERQTYESLLMATQKNALDSLEQGQNIMQVLEILLRLRQAACHQGLLPGKQQRYSAKTQRLTTALQESLAEGHKALVFSQWTSFLDLVEPVLEEHNLSYGRIDGKTKNRQDIVDQFQNTDDMSILLLSLKAAGTGLNLTAADHVFIMDPWWNPAIEEQAADRSHRIGQTKPVMVYRLVAKDTVEENILALQEQKRNLAKSILKNTSSSLKITKEELLALFE